MLNLAITFLVVALIAALLGFGGIVQMSMEMAWILFVVFLVLAVVSFIANGFRGSSSSSI